MTHKNLDREIELARAETLRLGGMVKQAVIGATEALRDQDMARSQEILDRDKIINETRYQIEGNIIAVIAKHQPTLHNLRILASMLDICTDLERMGDYAKGIAVINLRSGGLGLPKILQDIHFMALKAVDMLQRALIAFVTEDDTVAQALIKEDDLVDGLYQQLYFEVMDFIAENPHEVERSNYVLWVGHNLERLADRVTNICERTVFVTTGEIAFEFD